MLKWLVKWLNKIFKFLFGKKRKTRSTKPVGEQMVVQPPPELTNADLEFLFTQLLEGVHQARGQHWALKYLQRMENRISLERWINWLLDFGERLLTSPVPNNQLAERMVQLGELGIGTIGELSYDIGIRLLTRNLSDPYWNNDEYDTETTTPTSVLTPIHQEFIYNPSQDSDNHHQQNTATTPELPSNPPHQIDTTSNNGWIWDFTAPNIDTTDPRTLHTPAEDDDWVRHSLQAAAPEAVTKDDSLAPLKPTVAVALDELLVRLEQSTSLVQQLASGLGLQTIESPNQTNLLTNKSLSSTEQAQALFYQGLAAAKAGDLSGAIASYDKAIALNPDAHEYWFNRGLTLFYLGYFNDAIASYDKALELKPDYYKCWYNRGGALGELERFEDAIACFDKAIEIKFDYPEAWSSRAMALLKLNRPMDAVSSYDKALMIQPEDQENWYYRGWALAQSDRSNDAIASFDRALELQPDFYEAWYKRGVELSNLGRFEDAIASLEQATEIQPDFYEAWYALGNALEKIGQPEEAIASYDRATAINPGFHEVWIDRGVVLANLGRWYEAITSWETSLDIQPDLYLAWFNRAVALENLGRREDAIASYDKAIAINPDFYLAWNNRAVVLFYLARFEEAIASYDNALQIKLDYWEAWIGRAAAAGSAVYTDSHLTFNSQIASANPSLYERGYEGKLASYEEGLKYLHPETHQEGWGRLHLACGNAHYDEGKRYSTPHNYWQQAVTEYKQALKTLTAEAFPQLYLEVMQNLIKALISLGQTYKAQDYQQQATNLLQNLLNDRNRSDENKKQLALRNAGFWQLSVDIAVQSGEIAHALEIAEHGKNACLTWLLSGWSDEIISPSYRSIHELLDPTTAIIYWHISPCTLRSFIVKYRSPEPIPIFTPVLNVAVTDEMPIPEAVLRLVKFEDWLEDWNLQYEDYRSLGHNAQDRNNHSWQADMQQRLLKLKDILNISATINELEDITHLILIPHRDLHKLPLHALFNLCSPHENELKEEQASFTFTYLPSIQVGLSLKTQSLQRLKNLPMLSIEYPETHYPVPKFAKLESEAISQMFKRCKRLQGSQATKEKVENALSGDYKILHFSGYVINNWNQTGEAELILAGEEKLTLEDIYKKSRTKFNLITFSTCETAVANKPLISTEYVGLVTAFLSRGVGYAVSTLWAVESSASALVMIEFYRRLLQNKSAATALLEATEWLKELTAGELKKWYEEIFSTLSQEGVRIRTNLATELYTSSKLPADTKLYNHPYYWAAFTIAGKFYFDVI